jgi:hypothetical protein
MIIVSKSLNSRDKFRVMLIGTIFHIVEKIFTMQIFLLRSMTMPILVAVSSTSSFGGLSPSQSCPGFFSSVPRPSANL